MAFVILQGMMNTAGGVASAGQGLVYVGGVPMVVNGASVSSHPIPGPAVESSITTSSTSMVYINNVAVTRVGDNDMCGHGRSSAGQSKVNVNK